jgi:hypothetical protein
MGHVHIFLSTWGLKSIKDAEGKRLEREIKDARNKKDGCEKGEVSQSTVLQRGCESERKIT